MAENNENVSLETESNVAPDFEFEIDEVNLDFSDTATTEPQVVEPEKPTPEEPILTPPKEEEPKPESDEVIIAPPLEESTETPTEETVEVPEGGDASAVGIYNVMVEKGYAQKRDDFGGTFEELNEIFETLPEQVFQSVFQQFDEPMEQVLRFAYAKGDAQWEDIAKFVQEYNPAEFQNVSLESVDEQRNFVSRQMKAAGRDEDEINPILDNWEDTGKLEEKSKAILAQLETSKKEAAAAKVAELEKAKTNRKKEQKEFFSKVKSEIEKTKWTAERKETVAREVLNINNKAAAIRQNPTALYQLADFLSYYDMEKGTFNLDNYTKQGLTEGTTTVKNNIEKHFRTTPQTQSAQIVKKSKDGIDTSNLEFDV